MLSLEPAYYEIEGVIIYRDHAVPEQFYYASPNPEIARTNGRLLFDLYTYSVDLEHSPLSGTSIPEELGAGFLTMGTECRLSESRLSALSQKLSELSGISREEIIIFPIPYKKGTVRVLALDRFSIPEEIPGDAGSAEALKGKPTFVEKIIGAASPSLMGDLRAIFSLSLSEEGISFLEGLYEDNAAPIGIVYELEFYGLRPAVEARVTADLSRIYKHFGGGLDIRYEWIAADIKAGLNYLREQGHIKIELTSQATGEEAQKSKELALSLFKERIVQEMFRPTASTSRTPNFSLPGRSNRSGVRLTLNYKKTEELKTITYDFRESSPEKCIHSPQSFLPVLLSPVELQNRIHNIDLHNDFFEILEVLITGPTEEEFNTLKIRQVEVTLTYGKKDEDLPPETRSLLFRPGSTGDKTFAVKRRGRKSLSYTYTLNYDFARETGTDADSFRYELPQRTRTGRTMRINPYEDFGVLEVEVESGRIHPDIQEVDIHLTYKSGENDFNAEEHFRLAPVTPESTGMRRCWQVRTVGKEIKPYTVSCHYYFPDGTVYEEPAYETTEPLLRIDSPFHFERSLLLQPNVTSQVTGITVELEYEDTNYDYQRRFLVNLEAPFINKEIKWAILDANMQNVRYRVTVHEPGFSSTGDWQESADPSIVIGGPISRRAKVQVRLVGPSPAETGLDAVQLNIELADQEAHSGETRSLLFDGSQTSQDVILTLPPGSSLSYRYQIIYYKSCGEIVESEWKEGINSLLVITTRIS